MNQFKETSYSRFEYDIGDGDVLAVNAAAHQAIQKMLTEARAAALEEAASMFDTDINYAGIAAAIRALKEKT